MQSIIKYNISVSIIVFFILFLGAGTTLLLGINNLQNTTNSLWELISPPLKAMFCLSMFWIIKKRVKLFFEESLMIFSCFAYIILCSIAKVSANASILINVFISLAIMSLLLKNGHDLKKTILYIVLLYYFTECSIAIIERVTQINFLLVTNDALFFDETLSSAQAGFRSASIHSHPLQGALMISIVMSFILITSYNPLKKILMLFIGLLALFSFNTRSSIVYWALTILAYVFYSTIKKKFIYKIFAIFALISATITASYLINQGWAGRLMELSLFDNNSAQTRIDILNVLKDFSIQHFLFGVPNNLGETIFKRNGVYIMENYWITFIMNWGIPFTCWLVYCSYAILKKHMINFSITEKFFPIITFLLISSTNNSMITGVPALLLLLICFYSFESKINKKITQFSNITGD